MEDLSHYNVEGSELRRAQMRMVEILDVFVEICNKYNIYYWLACGILLGARRHAGFIRWDDDLDVYILQKDYKKLLSILQKELPEKYKLQARGTDKKYWYYFSKIRDTKSRLHDRLRYDEQGIFIDLWPIEPVPSIEFKKTIDAFLFSPIYIKNATSNFHKISFILRMAFLPAIHFFISLIRLYYRYISRTKLYAYAYGVFYYATYNKDNLLPIGEIIFEDKKYKAPGNVDKYLIENFDADFMVIPPINKRKKHSTRFEFF